MYSRRVQISNHHSAVGEGNLLIGDETNSLGECCSLLLHCHRRLTLFGLVRGKSVDEVSSFLSQPPSQSSYESPFICLSFSYPGNINAQTRTSGLKDFMHTVPDCCPPVSDCILNVCPIGFYFAQTCLSCARTPL